MDARLAVIIPTLNEAARICAALEALAPLRARGHQVIVVDGASDDATAELAAPLCDRVLSAPRGRAVQLNAGLSSKFSASNTAAQVLYLNTAHRWNWGIVGGQTPYLSGGTQSGIANLQGTPVEVDQCEPARSDQQVFAFEVAMCEGRWLLG